MQTSLQGSEEEQVKKVNVQVKMFMKYRKYLPPEASEGRAEISLEEGSSLEELMNILGIPKDLKGTAVVNGISYGVDHSQVLKEGDVVSFFSPVAGG